MTTTEALFKFLKNFLDIEIVYSGDINAKFYDYDLDRMEYKPAMDLIQFYDGNTIHNVERFTVTSVYNEEGEQYILRIELDDGVVINC